ncbi:MAG TPA: hypothetical protein VLS89_04655 [Candidatus Nanopelagicales bacterium]|nr:hypothetical protein [Candidatus Nanopelagicales bacterium]
MSKLFDISHELKPRAVPRPFDADDFEDASRIFIALRRLLARDAGQFQIRIGSLVLPFDLDPDLSTVFEDLPGVIHALDGEDDMTSPVELHFFEQGTDLTFVMQRRGNEVELVLRRGASSGPRYADVPAGPLLVSARQFLLAWARFLEDVLTALRRVEPGIEHDESYQAYTARIRSMGSSAGHPGWVAERLRRLRLPALRPVRSIRLEPASAAD